MKNDTQSGYLRSLMDIQYELFAHISALMGRTTHAEDVLQSTNIRIMELVKDAPEGEITHFKTWAKKVAFFQVLSWRTNNRRERIVFDSELLAEVSEQLAEREPATDQRLTALEECLKKLPVRVREMVETRYAFEQGVEHVAKHFNLSPRSVTVSLYRARLLLKGCIEQTLQGGHYG